MVQDMGVYATNLINRTFSDRETIDGIVVRLHPRLLKAMSKFDNSDITTVITSTGRVLEMKKDVFDFTPVTLPLDVAVTLKDGQIISVVMHLKPYIFFSYDI
jgi:hypothetical protein